MKYVYYKTARALPETASLPTIEDLSGRGIVGRARPAAEPRPEADRFSAVFGIPAGSPEETARETLRSALDALREGDSVAVLQTPGRETADPASDAEEAERAVTALAEALEDAGEDYRLLLVTAPDDAGNGLFLLYDSRFDLHTGKRLCRSDAASGPAEDLRGLADTLLRL